MDVFNIAKSIEKFIFELLMWLIFYPYTLFRVIFQPNSMMEYARHETARDEAVSFESGMKPAIFLFLSIVIAAYIAPVHKEELAAMNSTQAGQYITASWVNLLFFRMLIYSIFPIVAALIYDLATPGQVTRKSLQIPFNPAMLYLRALHSGDVLDIRSVSAHQKSCLSRDLHACPDVAARFEFLLPETTRTIDHHVCRHLACGFSDRLGGLSRRRSSRCAL
ncbi:hypothetical protein LP421_14130 [Rhizobium sp. RCAM05350]|nr:hypothetical protein LP421_14130 [Rhizobium sp. RCAM05350]